VLDIRESMGVTSLPSMKPDRLYPEFGKLVRGHRRRLGLTQDQLAERVGLSRTSITNIEQGRQKVLLHQVFTLADSLEVAPAALLPAAPHESSAQIEQKLPENLTAREKDWVRRVMTSGTSEGGMVDAASPA